MPAAGVQSPRASSTVGTVRADRPHADAPPVEVEDAGVAHRRHDDAQDAVDRRLDVRGVAAEGEEVAQDPQPPRGHDRRRARQSDDDGHDARRHDDDQGHAPAGAPAVPGAADRSDGDRDARDDDRVAAAPAEPDDEGDDRQHARQDDVGPQGDVGGRDHRHRGQADREPAGPRTAGHDGPHPQPPQPDGLLQRRRLPGRRHRRPYPTPPRGAARSPGPPHSPISRRPAAGSGRPRPRRRTCSCASRRRGRRAGRCRRAPSAPSRGPPSSRRA